MISARLALAALALLATMPAAAISPEGKEFLEILKQLEPVHCEKRKLRREIVMAEAEQREANVKALRARFAKLDAEPGTAKLERRLAELEPRINSGARSVPRDPEDLEAIRQQHRDAFYRCE